MSAPTQEAWNFGVVDSVSAVIGTHAEWTALVRKALRTEWDEFINRLWAIRRAHTKTRLKFRFGSISEYGEPMKYFTNLFGLLPLSGMLVMPTQAQEYDFVIKNGRVIDPEMDFDAVANVSIKDLEPQPNLKWFQDAYALTRWVRNVSTGEQEKQILSMIERGIKDGSIGIGLNSGYAPGYGYKEVLAVHQLVAKYGVPTFTRIRNLGKVDPDSSVQAYGELISYATAAGSHVHICRFNSASLTDISLAVRIIRDARKRGANITVEAYPSGAGSGAVNAAMFQPGNMKRMAPKPGILNTSANH